MEVALVCGSEFSLDYAANCPLMHLCFYNYESEGQRGDILKDLMLGEQEGRVMHVSKI